MPRIPYSSSSTGEDWASTYSLISAARNGRVGNLYQMMLHSPVVSKAWLGLGSALRYETSLPDDLRELTICTVAATTQSKYEWAHHAPIAEAAGLSRSEMQALWDSQGAEGFSGERDVCRRYARAVTLNSVSDALMGQVRSCFSLQQTIELTAISAYYTAVSRFLSATAVDEDAGLDR